MNHVNNFGIMHLAYQDPSEQGSKWTLFNPLVKFTGIKCFFQVENSHFGWPKTNFSGFAKWKKKQNKTSQKKKKKKKKKGPLLIW